MQRTFPFGKIRRLWLPQIICVQSRLFARNYNNRWKPNYKPPQKRQGETTEESSDTQMEQIKKMLGLANAYEHLLPKITKT